MTRVVFLLMLAGLAPPHDQARDTPVAQRGNGVIAGTVLSDDAEAKPLRRVRVTCTGGDVSSTAITDDRGRFAFSGLKPGRYQITGTKDSWLPTAYGAKKTGRPGSAIPLSDGQQVSIVLKLLRGSVITGLVTDYNREPAAYTTVTAMGYMMQQGSRRLTAFKSVLTDDRGVYRLYGLAPGDYILGVAGRARQAGELRILDERLHSDRTVSFAPTYYPGTTMAMQAGVVSIGPAQEREAIDFTLQLVPTARIEGSVTLADGSPGTANTQIDLIPTLETTFPGAPLAAVQTTRPAEDGTFRLTDIPPGSYTVLAHTSSPVTWSAAEVMVDGDDINGLSLAMQPGLTMTGRVRFEATRLKPPADLTSVKLSLQPVQSTSAVSFAASGSVLDPSGRFEIGGILPGRYRLTSSLPGLGRPGHWFLRSAIVNGVDVLDVLVDIRPGESARDAIVTITDQPAQLTGAIQNAAGGGANEFTVILFPADQALWLPQSRRTFAVRPSADGAFSFQGLVPGDYFIAAIDDVEPDQWFDPALLQRLMATALKLSIGEGEHKVQDLRLNK
jgi:uncharacterized protein (DUF2141 family)